MFAENHKYYKKEICLIPLRSMMMTACDLGAVTKPWEISRKVRNTLYISNYVFLNMSRAETSS